MGSLFDFDLFGLNLVSFKVQAYYNDQYYGSL